ncbi:MAG: lytic transglycosylase domain-containing protein [Lachnospiraceae bacterium]|nr:lytic transglycosylase domain-containing protein [Lachnospiraceae bacterium]
MRVNGIQSTDGTGAQAVAAVTGQGGDFSSYLQTTASLEAIFEEASKTYNVPKNLIKAIAKAESDFRPDATSKAGAQGIMQLMPATARELGVKDSYDPYQNIMGGTKYISQMLAKYNGDVSLALAAYNAGSNNVAKYGGIPPFKETQNYVVKVTQYMNEGVAVPNASYQVNSGAGTAGNNSVAAASVEEAEENYYQDILDQLFSYEDYLRFIEMYTKMQEAQQEKEEKEQEQQKDQSDSIYTYQEIKYSPAVMNLLGGNL